MQDDICKEKPNMHPLGDGTWCFEGRRDTECPAIDSKKTNCYLIYVYLYCSTRETLNNC